MFRRKHRGLAEFGLESGLSYMGMKFKGFCIDLEFINCRSGLRKELFRPVLIKVRNFLICNYSITHRLPLGKNVFELLGIPVTRKSETLILGEGRGAKILKTE